MLEMNTKNIRFLARMGSRGALGQAIYDYACDENDFFAVSADFARASGFERVIRDYPKHFVNVGIAEQNMIGVAAGLARMGTPVIATTWGTFNSARVADQVRNFLGFMQANVKLVGLDAGFSQARFGYSHSSAPDVAIMRAIPGITILSPCDGLEIYKAIWAAMERKGPVYIRLTGGTLLPIIHKDPGFEYTIGKSITLKSGTDVGMIATGHAVKNALAAAALLDAQGVSTEVVDLHTIEPLDTEMLVRMENKKLVITAEEHLLHGGMGSAVAEFYAGRRHRPQQIMLGVDNCYLAPGSAQYAEECTGLTPEQISECVMKELSK